MKKKILVIMVFGVFFLIQQLGGQTWTAQKRLTWTQSQSWFPAIATDSDDHIYAVWHDEAPGNYEVYLKKSTDGGMTWTTKRLTYNSGVSSNPDIAIDSSNHIHVVWDDWTYGSTEINYKKSTDGGATWTTKRLTWNTGASSVPTLAVDSNDHIHLVWQDYTPGNHEVFYKKSTNGGTSWKTKRLTWTSGESWYPIIATDSNNHIHVVWYDGTPGNNEIFYKKSTNGGASWTAKRLTWTPSDSNYPSLAIDSNDHIHVVWESSSPNEIYYTKSSDGGSTWTTKRLTWNLTSSYDAAIAVDSSDRLHVLWVDTNPGNSEIYYKRSTNGGASWTAKRLTWTSGISRYPDISIDSTNHIHVVWDDSTPGNLEIYYKKGIQ